MHLQKRRRSTMCGHQNERGIASLFLLFAMSAFSVLSVAALSTTMGSAPDGKVFGIFRSIPQDSLTKFVAPMAVPNAWRTDGASGSFEFPLPVIVPETGTEETGATAAWHAMTEVPGMSVCCEERPGVCSQRTAIGGGAPVEDWTPGAHDAQWLSFHLSSQPDPAGSDPAQGELVTATVVSPARPIDAPILSCQLEFEGAVIATGTAALQQAPRDDGSGLTTPTMTGAMTFAVRTR
jgi:hypothetical protein